MSASAMTFSLKAVCSVNLRSYKMEGGVEVAHGHNQGVDGATILQVTNQIYIKVL